MVYEYYIGLPNPSPPIANKNEQNLSVFQEFFAGNSLKKFKRQNYLFSFNLFNSVFSSKLAISETMF